MVRDKGKAAKESLDNIQKLQDLIKSKDIETFPMDKRVDIAKLVEYLKNLPVLLGRRKKVADAAVRMAEIDLKNKRGFRRKTSATIQEYLEITDGLISLGQRAANLMGMGVSTPKVESAQIGKHQVPEGKMYELIPINLKDWVNTQLRHLDEFAKLTKEVSGNGGVGYREDMGIAINR